MFVFYPESEENIDIKFHLCASSTETQLVFSLAWRVSASLTSWQTLGAVSSLFTFIFLHIE